MTRWPQRPVADMKALIAAIQASPIVAWRRRRPVAAPFGDWATVRRSGDVDAYVLAWIASHVRGKMSRAALQ
jgi:hypothetical protein